MMNEASKSQSKVIESSTQTPTPSESKTVTQSPHANTPNVSVLLSRFAAVSQRLQGTGVPGVPEWICISTLTNVPSMKPGEITGGIRGVDDHGMIEHEDWAYNPQACLAGCVVWAMEVAEWYGDRFPGERITCRRHTPESWIALLESIADAIGGG